MTWLLVKPRLTGFTFTFGCPGSAGCRVLVRYETGLIFPPIYAGTWQVSPVSTATTGAVGPNQEQGEQHAEGSMEGGDFVANVRGIDHYREFGYKGTPLFFGLMDC